MNNKEQAKKQILDFLDSGEKCMLLTGTEQNEKHKLIMTILNEYYEKNLFLFRTNAMLNIPRKGFLGWANVNKKPKSGEQIKIGKNYYECDSMVKSSTWYRTSESFKCAIVYPIDYLCIERKMDAIDNLFDFKDISKILLVSWMDNDAKYSMLNKYIDRHVIYNYEDGN